MPEIVFVCPTCQKSMYGEPAVKYLCPHCNQKVLCPTPPAPVVNKTVLGSLPIDVEPAEASEVIEPVQATVEVRGRETGIKVRCHLCGDVIDAADAVRRKMEVGQSVGSSSGYASGSYHHGSYHQGNWVNTTQRQSHYGLVDLCKPCDQETERRRRKLEKLQAEQVKAFVTAVLVILAAAGVCFIVLFVFFVILRATKGN